MTGDVVTRKTVRGLGRVYSNSVTGECYPSVTTIIGVLDSPALPRWASRTVAEFVMSQGLYPIEGMEREEATKFLASVPWKLSKRAANIGTLVHAAAEEILVGDTSPSTLFSQPVRGAQEGAQEAVDTATQGVRDLLSWLRAHYEVEVVLMEATVWSREHQYAGALDAILRVGEETWLVDWKTSKRPYSETSLQLAAYRHAEFTVDTTTGETRDMPHVDRSFIFHVPKEGGWGIWEMPSGEEEFSAFLDARRIHAYNRSQTRDKMRCIASHDATTEVE